MDIVSDLSEWKTLRRRLQGEIALVPTMGALHAGHMALVQQALAENEQVIVWIFVNPKQFGPKEDLADYPRDFDGDCALLEEAGVHYVLAPSVDQVYPPDFQTVVEVQALSAVLEGQHRPHHFRGVATVVAKMLCLTQPRRAYFGQKDGQQCRVVQQMVSDLGMLCEIVVCPTVREQDGLAMSSRNVYLNPVQRTQAVVLNQALQQTVTAIEQGQRSAAQLKKNLLNQIQTQPLAEVEYVSIADAKTLAEATQIEEPVMISLAVRFGKTRLIDNMVATPL